MCGNTECNVSVGKLEMWQYCSENVINLRRSPGSSYLQHRTLATRGQRSQLPVAFASDAQQCCGWLCLSCWSSSWLEQRDIIAWKPNPLKANIQSRSCSKPVTTLWFCALPVFVFHAPVDLQNATAGVETLRRTHGSNADRKPIRDTMMWESIVFFNVISYCIK